MVVDCDVMRCDEMCLDGVGWNWDGMGWGRVVCGGMGWDRGVGWKGMGPRGFLSYSLQSLEGSCLPCERVMAIVKGSPTEPRSWSFGCSR